MMAAGPATAPVLNGIHSAPPAPTDLAEYEKIVRLRDDVFAGRHPRLKLASASSSQNILQQPSGVPVANAAAVASNHAAPFVFPSQNASSTLLPSSLPSGGSSLYPNHIAGQSASRIDALPGLDPALLGGPPLLTPADRNLSRSVIQAHLANEVKRKSHVWPKLDRENILPDYDVDELLRKAHREVKPLTFDKSQTKDRAPVHEAQDDNDSYYSSQVNDEEENGEIRMNNSSKPCAYFFQGKCSKGDACNFSHDPAFAAQLKPAAPLTTTLSGKHYVAPGPEGSSQKRARREDVYDPAAAVNPPRDSPGGQLRLVDEYGRTIPPTRLVGYETAHQETGYMRTPPSAHRQAAPERRPSGRTAPPTRDGPIIRNQVLSPVAPQPARVSPLATSKGIPRIEHIRLDHPRVSGVHNVNHGQQSPSTLQNANRKRRRDPEFGDNNEMAIVRRRVESPSVQIKDEPVSPKPLEGIPQYRYVAREDTSRQPILVESYPVNGRRIEQEGSREIHYIDEPGYRRVSSPMVRVVSRAEPRYEVRREPELRRVVSERQSLRVASPALQSPRHHAIYEDGQRSGNQQSVAYLSLADNERPSTYRASVAPASQHHPARSGFDSVRSEFAEPRRVSSPVVQQTMRPPPIRRIIRDQFGNEFYESAPEPTKFSAAPASELRYAPEHAYATRPVSRMTSVMPESSRQVREGTIVRREEPEPTSPRYIGGPTNSRAPSAAPYARREAEFVGEAPQIVRLDDGSRGDNMYERVIYRQGPPQTVYTDRPNDGYYDSPREPAYRVQSVRPHAIRHGSMAPGPQRLEYVDDRARQYMPAREDRQYIME